MEAISSSSLAAPSAFPLSAAYCSNYRRPTLAFAVKTDEKPSADVSYSTKNKNAQADKTPKMDSQSAWKSADEAPERTINGSYVSVSSATSSPSLPAALCNAVDDFINVFIDQPLRPSVDPRFVLSGNFAPTQETPPTECLKVDGILPACLDGVYMRNGPNPKIVPRSGHHLFDGDGMLHAVAIKDGRATFCSRFVRTNKLMQEDLAGNAVFPNFFAGFYSFAGLARGALLAARVALGQINLFKGAGLANTSVVFFDNKLMALGESDVPYIVKLTADGDIQTVGRYDFGGKLFMSMTAHPKIDPRTGEMFAFRYGPVPPFLNFFRVASGGEKQPDVPIRSLLQPSFIHDFAITAKYAIFPDTQIVVNPLDMIVGDGSPIGCNASKVPRLGVIPRYATDDSAMKWFQVPGFNPIHCLNAWDEGDEVVLVAANSYPVEHILERTDLVHCSVEKVRIHLPTGRVTRKPLSSKSLEFAVINPRFVAKKNRFGYASVGAPMPKILGVVKLDFDLAKQTPDVGDPESCVVASRIYGQDWFGSEPFFVPRSSDMNAGEDDGYVVALTHNERTGMSRFVVMDARSPTLEIVASIHIPRRVPYGFHGLFVGAQDLAGHAL